MAAVIGLIALYSLALGLGKLLFMPGSRVRRLGSLERSLADFLIARPSGQLCAPKMA